ncbi:MULTISPECIES: molybdopterin-dependent oxidoreductase [Pelosinus]|uniref:Molybdopterin oxidoreductase n=1 Tax=Pelosinus fermentans B4 TaxID=1149862 RepID=I9LBZ2_9FIRM|nr:MULTISPECIES: molybdopterin-dependent oxidoreductase [Pelosinus]EIW17939.1 molybdopterin oxidoreductase [Pelosinus fermentans B4]EIW23901.1 molybdopterin oxidoreductase [Pelosinus fermentans A11]OAM94824.1 Nitrate reductase [Pelosinus fermentans DSM 17108]SDR18397.1 Anaerobic selenocysteine-containing dehydrogenase [Pelosinus fermentans]
MNPKIEVKRSVCPYDCPDTCGLMVETVEGKAVRVTGDPDHPHTRGTLCSKMNHYEKTVHSPERLTKPLLRTGSKGAGEFKEISWEEAIFHIKERWQGIIAEYGSQAILPYSYAGTMGVVQRNIGEAFFHRLGASRLERTICSSAKGYGWSAVMGSSLAPHPQEVSASDLIILWGTNILATNIHLLYQIREAKKAGAVVWLIETYQSSAAQFADKVIMVRPGSDGALALGMMRVLVDKKLIAEEFVAQYVQGFEAFEKESLPEYSLDAVSKITGIDAASVEEIGILYGKARAPFIVMGSGLSRYGNGAMTVRAITCLPALVGAWAKVGGGLLASIGTGSAFAMDSIIREDFMQEPTRIVNMNQLGHALQQITNPPIMSMYVYHSNPAIVAPDQNAVVKGLLREELFMIVHERFMTDTARYADLVLPATSSLEHSDIYRSYGHYCVQRAYPVIPPVGEAKSNWDVFRLLASAMGFEESFFEQTTDEIIQQLLESPKPWLEQIDMNKVQEGMAAELPLPPDYKITFKTPSGKIEIFNPREIDPFPTYKPSHGDDAPFWLMNAPGLYSLNSSFNERPDLLEKRKAMYLMMNPYDAEKKGFKNGQEVIAFNERGEVVFILKIASEVPSGIVVTEGIFWIKNTPGKSSVNALTSQRLTDRGAASTFYDTKVDVRSFH